MAGVYSTRFFLGGITGGGSSSLYAVPVGYAAILRQITARYVGGTAGTLILGNATYQPVGYTFTGTLEETWEWQGRHLLEPGEELTAYQTTDFLISAWVTGYLLGL